MQLNLFSHQAEFVSDITTRNLLLCGGYGSGKTKALVVKLIVLAKLNPGCVGIALSPTYAMAIRTLVPTIEDELAVHNIKFKFNKSELVFYIDVGHGKITTLYILAAETFKRAAGLNCAFFGIDEADLLSHETFVAAWRMLSSRLRRGKVYQGVAVTTPEGFRGCWTHWVDEVQKNPALMKDRRLIQASTYDNPTLPPEFIQDLETQYAATPQLLRAYLRGEFVNLSGLPVYPRYKPAYDGGNWTHKTLDSFPDYPLHIGLDFNKSINPCEVHVIDKDYRYLVDEIYGLRDTDACIAEIKARYPNRIIDFYPDANGFEERNNYEKNFGTNRVHYNEANPRVFRRVASLHVGILNPVTGERKYFVNPEKAPQADKSLRLQVYNQKGEPDKDGGLDHPCDAAGYLSIRYWPADELGLERQAMRL
jgi:hypothetical protein